MNLETFFSMVLPPNAPAPNERFLPRGQSADKYVFPDDVEGATEVLSGSLITLPGKECLEGVDLSSPQAVQNELGKAWVGGYVLGREWALQNITQLLAIYLQRLNEPLIAELAAYNWGEDATQPEVLDWLSHLAILMRAHREADAETQTHAVQA